MHAYLPCHDIDNALRLQDMVSVASADQTVLPAPRYRPAHVCKYACNLSIYKTFLDLSCVIAACCTGTPSFSCPSWRPNSDPLP